MGNDGNAGNQGGNAGNRGECGKWGLERREEINIKGNECIYKNIVLTFWYEKQL